MAFRFWRRIRIAKGVTLNVSKRGASVSLGPRGGKYTIGPHGQRVTAGLTGTGLFYTKRMSTTGTSRKRSSRSAPNRQAPATPPQDRLSLGFFQRMVVPKSEQAFLEGMKALVGNHDRKALDLLMQCPEIADASFMAGFVAIRLGLWDQAEKALLVALEHSSGLARMLSKYGLAVRPELAVTDDVLVQIPVSRQGVQLGMVEVWQEKGEYQKAADILMELRKRYPDDIVVKLSLAELLLTVDPQNRTFCQKVVKYSAHVTNESAIHAALLYYKGKALRTLGMPTAARDTLTTALRRTKDRPEELLRSIRYERGLVYEELGQAARARSEFERLYALDPDFEDVAEKLGVG